MIVAPAILAPILPSDYTGLSKDSKNAPRESKELFCVARTNVFEISGEGFRQLKLF